MTGIMSVDVEEWFHIPYGNDNIVPFGKWDISATRVTYVVPKILDLFDKNNVKATFFFVGWIAEKYPDLVIETKKRGHEIASHGYAHKLVYNQTREEFKEDIYRSKCILEDIIGTRIIGYRAPGFSITPDTVWAFDILSDLDFKYDSSVFPGRRFLGHFDNFGLEPVWLKSGSKNIIEFPQTLLSIWKFRLSFFGGGYFRLFPGYLIKKMARIVIENNRQLIFYIHPRDLDPDQPRIDFSLLEKLRYYINISKTEQKLVNITSAFNFVSFSKIIEDPSFLSHLRMI